MLVFVIIMSLIFSVLVNIMTSCYVCYNVAIDSEAPLRTLISVAGVVIINALFPFLLGCITGLWYYG